MIEYDNNRKQDIIYVELIKDFSEKFLSFSDQEKKSLSPKMNEYQELLKKAELAIFIMMNINTDMT